MKLMQRFLAVVAVICSLSQGVYSEESTDTSMLSTSLLARAQTQGTKIGVLMLNLGGPKNQEDVEGFLYNLFADPDIIRLPAPLSPLQPLIATMISKKRAPKSREAYASIGGGSPIMKYTSAQAELLEQSLKDRHGLEAKAYIGMRYWEPYTEEAVKQIKEDAVDVLVVMPLYPQFSISTSGSSLRVLAKEFSSSPDVFGPDGSLAHTVIPSWYDRPGYINVMSKLIQQELDSISNEAIATAQEKAPELAPLHVLFSAHGVPQSYIEAGDPYKRHIEECVELISAQIMQSRQQAGKEVQVEVHLSFQSRVGPVEWLRPYTDDVLPELAHKGVRNLVVVPISFVSEHIETLEEIDGEYKELAIESGIVEWRRSPALNTDEDFIADMADMVYDALSQPSVSVASTCDTYGIELRSESSAWAAGMTGLLAVTVAWAVSRMRGTGKKA
eukprot:Nitzschia sp. Nitz4//scaffold5_size260463//49567//50974//NITZ4_000952-RA/size260463-augustus-gene-0.2-mRNA-1//1//CDS//3329555250//5422//frame0